jgi:hypothetical protein
VNTCRWPSGCREPGDPLCYYHSKLSTGLIDGRDHLPLYGRKPDVERYQGKLAADLRGAGAPEEVVARAVSPVQRGKQSKNGGGGIPHGRLHPASAGV